MQKEKGELFSMKNQLVKSNLQNISASVYPTLAIPFPPQMHSDFHFHDELEFLYIEQGEFRCDLSDKSYTAKAGDIIFINSRIPHSTRSLEYATFYSMLQFSPDNFSNASVDGISKYLAGFLNSNKEYAVIFKSSEPITAELRLYLLNIFNEYRHKKPAYELYIKSYICNIIAFLSRNNILTDSSTFFDEKNIIKVMPALDYIDRHYSEQIQLEDLSRVLNLNQSYFCRLFKRATNSTFIEYLNFIRVCKAERILSKTTEPISEVSLNLGFASVSYFNKIFKRFKGCTPTEYRKSKYLLQ